VSSFALPDNNAIDLASETVLLDNMPSPNGNHNGGDLNFGKDGFLYVSIGDGGCDYADDSGCAGSNDAARDLHVLSGKVLRITRDGNIPPGNPFTGDDTARCNGTGRAAPGRTCQETFAWGLRNPFRFGFDPNAAETRFFINDVGQGAWEEIDYGQAGADYGWNCREGAHTNSPSGKCSPTPPDMVDPIHEYSHATGCRTISGGAFVPAGAWPAEYTGAYIFADFLCGKLFALRQGSGGWTATEFASDLGFGVVHLRFGPPSDPQALYYTTYGNGGQVRRITQRFTDVPPGHPAYQAVEELRTRGLVKGYAPAGCAGAGLASPCYGPADTSLRAQMAVMIVRAMGWSGEQATNPFTDRGGLNAELWEAVGILAVRGVAEGYGDGRFGPNDTVSQAQLVSFVTRAMIERGFWQPAAQDDPSIYPNVPSSTGHRLDLVTYVQNAGALPDYPARANWASWNGPATREWFARVLWQALDDFLAVP
jgi:hypothetical protein